MDGDPATDVPDTTFLPRYGDANLARLQSLSEGGAEDLETRSDEATVESREFRRDLPLADTPTQALDIQRLAAGRTGVVR